MKYLLFISVLLSSVQVTYGRFGEAPFSLSLENDKLDFQNNALSADVLAVRGNFSVPLSVKRSQIVAVTSSYESLFYQWKGDSPGFNRLSQGRLGLFSLNTLPRKWRAMTLTNLQFNTSEGVNPDDGLTLGGIYGAWYEGWDKLLLGGGFGFSTNLNDATSFFPLIFVDWEFKKNWRLTTRPTPGTRFGPGVSLMYQPETKWSTFCGIRYVNQEYELEGGNIYSYSTTRLFTTLVYSATENVMLSFTLGLNLGGEVEIEGENYDLETTPFVGSNVSWVF